MGENDKSEDLTVGNDTEKGKITSLEQRESLLKLQILATNLKIRIEVLKEKNVNDAVLLEKELEIFKKRLDSKTPVVSKEIEEFIGREVQSIERQVEDREAEIKINAKLDELEKLTKKIVGPRVIEILSKEQNTIASEDKIEIVNILTKEEIEKTEEICAIIEGLKKDFASYLLKLPKQIIKSDC